MPFIGLNIPFVGLPQPHVRPFICKNGPSVKIPRFSGFTLIELIVTVVIAGILMALAAPSFSNFVKNNRLSSQANGLMADLAFARSEAVKRGANITVCRASDPFNTCTNSAGPWSTGWIVIDLATNNVLRVHEALSGQNTLTGTGALADQTAYTRTGLITLGAAQSFSLCDDRPASYGRLIQISITGRAHISDTPPASC